MTNHERVITTDINGLAKIIRDEFCGTCRSCNYYYTSKCRYDEEGNDINPNACVSGIEAWLNSESNITKQS